MPMFIDSHCHLDFSELASNMDAIQAAMRENQVGYGLCISVTLPDFPNVLAIAEQHPNLFATVGVHPDYENEVEPTVQELVRLAQHPKVIGIGETGLDYFRLQGDLEWQRSRFRTHIQAAIAAQKPLIIHTRSAAEDTLNIMKEEGADQVGGIMHCFTESWEVAQAAMDMGFYISFAGPVTYPKNQALREIAMDNVPLDRILCETDSPYLAPQQIRGKTNQPCYVRAVYEMVSMLKGMPLEGFAEAVKENGERLFGWGGSVNV